MSEFDPKGHDRGPMTSGPRIADDFRSHIDRLNGPWASGPAANPALVLKLAAEAAARVEAEAAAWWKAHAEDKIARFKAWLKAAK